MNSEQAVAAEPILQADFMHGNPVQAANILEHLDATAAAQIVAACDIRSLVPVLERLSPAQAQLLLERIDASLATAVLNRMSIPRAALLLRVMSDRRRNDLLDRCDAGVRHDICLLLDSPAGSAAAIMDPRVLHLHPTMKVKDALDMLRLHQYQRTPSQARRIMLLLDANKRINGMVAIQDLALAEPGDELRDYMQAVPATVQRTASREEILAVLDEHRVSSVPVVDEEQRLIGIVRLDELAAIAREDAVGDIQAMVGVSRSEQALSPPWFSVRQRLPWLQINLLTAFAAAAVVGVFEATIASYTALAILLPVVAGQSGNTGAQALAVVMRGLSLREISINHWGRVLRKEFIVSLFNGAGVACTTALAVFLWSRSPGLTAIIAIAMVLSMGIAGISGAAVPLLLTRFGLDPAQSSSIILTTVTDVAGFFSFLGIATLLITTL